MKPTFDFDRFNVFGWIIHRKKLKSGDEYTVHAPEDIDRKTSDSVSIWSKGRVVVTHLNSNDAKEDRVPGMFSLDRPVVTRGSYSMKAVEDSEFWCINYSINRRKLPKLEPFVLEAGESKFLPKDSLLLVCTGTVSISDNEFSDTSAIKFTGRRKVSAKTPIVGLIFGSENV